MPLVAEEVLRRIFDAGGGRCQCCQKVIHYKNYRRRGSRGAWAVNRSGNLSAVDVGTARPVCFACLGEGAGSAHAVSRAAPARPATLAQAAAEHGRAGRRVLLVDDDRETLSLTAGILSAAGARVVMAFSGGEAIARVRLGEKFDVVISDLRMPGMSGWDVAERIAQLAPGTPVYVLTGWARDVAPDDPKRRLVVNVLAKPLEPAVLQQVLEVAAGGR
jgi:CheY-like chemotaxis protein